MKSLVPQGALLALIVGGFALLPEKTTGGLTPYSFDPAQAQQNICGPIGMNRGLLFRPEVAQLLSSAVYAATPPSGDVALIKGLDTLEFSISTKNTETQAFFRQGYALMYGFNHFEAIRAFKKAQQLDPECAMCYWGEAMALGPNINAGMSDEAGEKALVAINRAQELKSTASAREVGLIEAAAKRYSADEDVSRDDLNQQFVDAMAALMAEYPEDDDIAVMYAESIMTSSPWNYWERDFTTPRAEIKPAIHTIEKVLARNPDQYGAIHFYIHLNEASTLAERAAPYAERLAGLAPGAGHLVHMPGHIFFRIGRYIESLDTNVDAVGVDEAYLNSTQGSNLYRYGYYPHNVHFVLVSAQMAGDSAISLEYAEKLDQLLPDDVLKEIPWVAPIKAAPYFALAQFGEIEDVLALPRPGIDNARLVGMWHFARGAVLAQAGDIRAEAEKAAIEKILEKASVKSGSKRTRTVLAIAGNLITAKLSMYKGDFDGAIKLLEETVVLQDSMSYNEPPNWYHAIEQSLGSALYMAGKYDDAELAFQASLIRHPNSAWSLYGLLETQKKLGNADAMLRTEALYKKASRANSKIDMMKL